MDLTSGSSGSDAPLTVSVSCIHCIVLFGARWPEACELCLACPPPPSMSQLAQWLSGFYRFYGRAARTRLFGSARALARSLPFASSQAFDRSHGRMSTRRRALRKLVERRSTGGDAVRSLDTSPERAGAALARTNVQRHLARRRGRFCSAHAVCRVASRSARTV